MENNRVKLDICGVSIALITDKDESYVHSLADEITAEISPMISSGISKDRAALLAAFNYLDELKTKSEKAADQEELEEIKAELQKQTELNASLQSELEKISVAEDRINALEKENEELKERLEKNRDEEYEKMIEEALAEIDKLNDELKKKSDGESTHKPVYSSGELRNPMRPTLEADGMVDYYAKD